jgi:hypothetical protein
LIGLTTIMPSLRPTIYPLPLIGWRERVHLPKLELGPLIAKVDTGARSAALHAEDIIVRGSLVRFAIPTNGRKHHYELPIKGQRRVKSTSGHSEMRAVVETDIAIGAIKFTAEITLTDRTDMGVPMLLGRATIRGKFIVHPGRSFLISRTKRKIK